MLRKVRKAFDAIFRGPASNVILAMFGGALIDQGVAHHGDWYRLVFGILFVIVALGYSRDRPERPPPKSFGERVLFYFGL